MERSEGINAMRASEPHIVGLKRQPNALLGQKRTFRTIGCITGVNVADGMPWARLRGGVMRWLYDAC